MSKDREYELTLERRPEYVYACVKAASISLAIIVSFLSEAVEFCNEQGLERILLVRDIPAMLSDTDIYFAGIEFSKTVGTIKLALVNPFSNYAAPLDFVETVTSNRGAQMKVFSDAAEAAAWLLM
ncbi:MAG: hypothetical protein QM785_13080 [Pyrinomonadaceae bacterium]